MHACPVARGRSVLQWGIALAAMLALLQPALVTFDVDLSGWRTDHGHLFVSSTPQTVPAHEHPYDHAHTHEDDRVGDAAAEEQSSEGRVVFVSGDDVTSTVLPASTYSGLRPRLAPPSEQAAIGGGTPTGVAIAPPAPPPRI